VDRECFTCGESIKPQHPPEIDEELFVCRILLTLAHRSIKRFSYGSMSYMCCTAKGGRTNHFGRLILPSRESLRECVVDSINPRPLLPNLLQKYFVEIAQREQRLNHLRSPSGPGAVTIPRTREAASSIKAYGGLPAQASMWRRRVRKWQEMWWSW
jgi:hypothetical protein